MIQRMLEAAVLAATLVLAIPTAAAQGAAPPAGRAAQLIGAAVHDPKGSFVGEVRDLVVDLRENRVTHVVMSVGTFLGVGDRLVAYPLPSPELKLEATRAVLDTTREKLKAMQGFRSTEWPDFNAGAADAAGAPPRYARASVLLDRDVLDRQGGDVGDVEDLLLHLDGRVANAVVKFIPSWYSPGSLVALPITSLDWKGTDFVAKFEASHIQPADAARKRAEDAARAEAAAKAAAKAAATTLDRGMRASRIIGMQMVDRAGNALGKIEDLLVDPRQRRATHAVVSVEGAGAKQVALALPPKDATLDKDRIVLAIDRQALLAMPAYAPGQSSATAVPASRILKAEIDDPSGKDVGHVRDVVVNMGEGRVNYAVAEFTPDWVQEGKLVALPLRELRRSEGENLAMQFQLNELQRTYFFDKGKWPDLNDRSLLATMEQYVNKP